MRSKGQSVILPSGFSRLPGRLATTGHGVRGGRPQQPGAEDIGSARLGSNAAGLWVLRMIKPLQAEQLPERPT